MSEHQDVATLEERIESKIDKGVTGGLAVASGSGMLFRNAGEVMEFAKMMAVGGIAIRKQFRGNPGACLAVCLQALDWNMSPFAVANKSYPVNDQLGFESALLHALVLTRAPIKGRPKCEYKGDGTNRTCRVWATLRDEPDEIVDYISPPTGTISPKNSPLWKTDPDQQLWYYSVRAWSRRHFPDVLLGIYAEDELPESPHQGPEQAKDVTPADTAKATLNDAFDKLAKPRGHSQAMAEAEEWVDPDTGEILKSRDPDARPSLASGQGGDDNSGKPPAASLPPEQSKATVVDVSCADAGNKITAGLKRALAHEVASSPPPTSGGNEMAAVANADDDMLEAREAAYQRGREMQGKGMLRKAVPVEYRTAEMKQLAGEWLAGWDAGHNGDPT